MKKALKKYRRVISLTSKLRISEEVSEKLDELSRKLGLRRNIVCRIAVGRSVSEGKFEEKTLDDFVFEDSNGYEFNRYTLTGEYDEYFKALIVEAQGKSMSDEDYFTQYLRKHIERGIRIMYKEIQRVGSKYTYLNKLANSETIIEINSHV